MYDAKLLSSYCTIKKWILKILIQLFYNNFQDKMINILYLHTCKNNWVRQAVKKKHRCDDGAGRGLEPLIRPCFTFLASQRSLFRGTFKYSITGLLIRWKLIGSIIRKDIIDNEVSRLNHSG